MGKSCVWRSLETLLVLLIMENCVFCLKGGLGNVIPDDFQNVKEKIEKSALDKLSDK